MKLLAILQALREVAPFLKGVAKFLVLWYAKHRGKQEAIAEQDRKNAKRQEEYGKIASEHRDADDTSGRLHDGSF